MTLAHTHLCARCRQPLVCTHELADGVCLAYVGYESEFVHEACLPSVTLTHLLRAADTMEQFRLLAIADRLFMRDCGRYYAGPLTPEDLLALAPPAARPVQK